MKLTGAKVTEINRAYFEKSNLSDERRDALKISVGNDYQWSDKVYCGNWMVCRIDDLADMIVALQDIKQTIEEQTGIIL